MPKRVDANQSAIVEDAVHPFWLGFVQGYFWGVVVGLALLAIGALLWAVMERA